jgi:hypothetical protein
MILTTRFTVEMFVLSTLRCKAVMTTWSTIKDPLSIASIPLILQIGLVRSSSFSACRRHGGREQVASHVLSRHPMSQNQHPSQEGPQNNSQIHYSSLDRSRLPKSGVNATRTPQQHGVEHRDTPGVASGSIFKNSTNSTVHPGNPNGSFVAQGTSWQGSLHDRTIYNTPTPSGGPSRSLSSSGGSLQSAGQRQRHFYPTPEAADQLYGNVAGRRYDESSQYVDPEQDGNLNQNSRGSVGHPSNSQSMFPFSPEDPMTGPYSRLGSPVEDIEEVIARGGNRGSHVGQEMTVVMRQVCALLYADLF